MIAPWRSHLPGGHPDCPPGRLPVDLLQEGRCQGDPLLLLLEVVKVAAFVAAAGRRFFLGSTSLASSTLRFNRSSRPAGPACPLASGGC